MTAYANDTSKNLFTGTLLRHGWRTWMHTNTYGSRYVLLRSLGDDIDYTKETYYVADGMCGFAWINIKPGQR